MYALLEPRGCDVPDLGRSAVFSPPKAAAVFATRMFPVVALAPLQREACFVIIALFGWVPHVGVGHEHCCADNVMLAMRSRGFV